MHLNSSMTELLTWFRNLIKLHLLTKYIFPRFLHILKQQILIENNFAITNHYHFWNLLSLVEYVFL